MGKATFRFYEELNDFLPKHRHKKDFSVEFEGERSVGDMIEAVGAPRTHVDLILANGEPVDFDCILRDGDRVSVYPVFESLNIENVIRHRNAPLRMTRFFAAPGLGEVVKVMRALGFDVYRGPSLSDREMIDMSNRENRIILTKDRRLMQREGVTRAIHIRPGTIKEQVNDILDRLDMKKI